MSNSHFGDGKKAAVHYYTLSNKNQNGAQDQTAPIQPQKTQLDDATSEFMLQYSRNATTADAMKDFLASTRKHVNNKEAPPSDVQNCYELIVSSNSEKLSN